MHQPVSAVDQILHEGVTMDVEKLPSTLASGSMSSILKKAKQLVRDAKVKENYKLCRKKCKLFKCNKCWEKTFEEQKKCYENGHN